MPLEPRLTAVPVMRLICRKSGNLAGFMYLWNNGDLQIAWLDEVIPDIRYEIFEQVA